MRLYVIVTPSSFKILLLKPACATATLFHNYLVLFFSSDLIRFKHVLYILNFYTFTRMQEYFIYLFIYTIFLN